jgi:hypothetical protein
MGEARRRALHTTGTFDDDAMQAAPGPPPDRFLVALGSLHGHRARGRRDGGVGAADRG